MTNEERRERLREVRESLVAGEFSLYTFEKLTTIVDLVLEGYDEVIKENTRIKDALYCLVGHLGGPTEESYKEAHEILFGKRRVCGSCGLPYAAKWWEELSAWACVHCGAKEGQGTSGDLP